ncbi:hypothetical protein [Komagataeibacter europaeus]|uniref:hypothetical protein n=1 Tax=Komagataeibacter europaeus TaxID=33995 RepID=UPI000312327D|nr:hypothetical protein [Komagataeibacter europaeus]
MAYPPLDPEEIKELKEFAAQEGRNWKQVLEKESWWRGLPMHGFPLLYGLRNSHGPSWLRSFRLPTE